jgi:hypothetical protein
MTSAEAPRRSPTTDGIHPDYGVRPYTQSSPSYLDTVEKRKIRTAAYRAARLYPGPVGEVLARELLSWEEFGVRLGANALITALIKVITETPLTDGGPEPGSAAPTPWRPGFPPWRRS